MPVTIRPARPGDAPHIVEYNRRMAWETEHKALDAAVLAAGVAAVLADAGRGRYFVAEQAGAVVGQLLITYEWSDWRNGWLWWIQSVYVEEASRGQGVYRALYEHVSAAARQAGDVVGLRLYVERDNRAAQQVYERLGMVPAGYLFYERCPL